MSQEVYTLAIEDRQTLGKTSKRLPGDKMAAVYYGRKEKATPIVISKPAFKRIFRLAGESSVVVLEGNGKKIEALIHEVDFDPVKDEPRHADFYVLEKGKKVTVSVPVHFEGESPAVKNLGGILVKVMHEIEVEAEAKDLPHAVEVDISALTDLDSQITVGDLKLPAGVISTEDKGEVVAAVSVAKEEEEVSAPIDISAIEVEKKGKKEEEGGEEAAENK
jgi:large subunit ribosomal protein L25